MENAEILKQQIQAACERCRTKIECRRGNGFEIIFPVILPEAERTKCVALYDECVEKIKIQNKMYMPEPIERETPAKERLMFLMRQFLSERSGSAAAAQTAGTQFNQLFGTVRR